MKRSEIKRRPLSDTVIANLEADVKEYRELDGNSLYIRVKPDGNKSWQLRYKKPDGKWSWLGLGGYPEISGQLARKKAKELLDDVSKGENPIISKQERKRQELEQNNATFELLAREYLDTKVNSWVVDTMTRNKGALEKHIFPVFGKCLYTTIRPIEWMNHLKGIQQEQGIYEQVNRIRAMPPKFLIINQPLMLSGFFIATYLPHFSFQELLISKYLGCTCYAKFRNFLLIFIPMQPFSISLDEHL